MSTPTKKPEKSLAAFKQLYDPNVRIPAQVKAGLESMIRDLGPEAWEYELDFAKRCAIGTAQIGAFREQFDKHNVIVRSSHRAEKRVWFGDAKIAAKARGDG